jgi:hypothetical protein
MWLCFNDAFVSAVQDKDDPDRLCVRARKREHLERLFPGHEILTPPTRDYAYRVFVSKKEFADLLATRIGDIDYTNFKNSVRDGPLHQLYVDFWELHHRYQRVGDRSRHLSWGPGDIEIDDDYGS